MFHFLKSTNNKYGIDLGDFDFLDLGAKKGGSIEYCQERFRARRGLGIDMKEEVVSQARDAGYTVLLEDALKFESPHKYRFTSMLDFLEHLPNEALAKQVIEKYAALSRDFLFIRHPSFEDSEYLRELGLKITWQDWEEHTNMMLLADYSRILAELGLNQYCFIYRKPILSSDDKYVIPLKAPQGTHEYSAKLGKKPKIKFDRPLYGQIDIFIALRPFRKGEWNTIISGSL